MRCEFGVPFWSYGPNDAIPSDVIIEHVLLFRQVEDMLRVVTRFGYDRCLDVFKKAVLTQKRRFPIAVSLSEEVMNALATSQPRCH